MQTKALLLVALALPLAAAGCASTPSGQKDDLDVAMTPPPTDGGDDKPVTYADVVPAKGTAPGQATIPKNAVINWQAFFKAPPNAKERSLLEQRLEHWPEADTAKDLVAKGRVEAAVGRLAAAETDFRKAIRLQADDLGAQIELADLFLKKKSLTDAFELLAQVKEGISTSDDVPQSLIFKYRYTLGLAHIANGDRNKGHKILSDLIGVDKTFAPAYASLAASYLAIGKDSVAEFVVRRGLDRVKDDPSLLNLMGVIAQKNHQPDVARTWYDKALLTKASYAPALVNRATLSAVSLEYGAAEEDLIAALNSDPQCVDALVALGVVQRRQGNVTGARASFTKAVDLDPDNAFARFNLGVLLADDLKKPNEALRLFHEVLQTAPAGSEIHELAHNYINDLKPAGEPF